ncbi:MAG TPA: hypothetical protein ENG87_03215 [Candidatus Pacearchaeota archaeon]|nr:hypothetical protein [Candidatus Pacearchaeota archaeon]HDZ61175.1 hypothetical protein [Candidatus Pacearchaeota archaeon]
MKTLKELTEKEYQNLCFIHQSIWGEGEIQISILNMLREMVAIYKMKEYNVSRFENQIKHYEETLR